MSQRLSVRLPASVFDRLREVSETAGYPSPSMLVRCVLVQFLNKREVVSRICSDTSDWVDDVVSDHLDPTQRKRINERL